MAMGSYRLGLILITLSAVAWSTTGLFTRLIPLDAWTMLAWRGLFGAIGLAAVIVALERRRALDDMRRLGWPGWAFALVSAAGMVLYITSLRHTTVAHNAVIYTTAPFMAAGLGFLLMREIPARSAVLASGAALIGVAIMVGLGLEGGLLGDLLAVAMTLCMAAMMVIARHWRDIPVMHAACVSAVISSAVCWPLGDPLGVGAHDLWMLAAFGIVNSAVGLALFTLGARLLPAIETALIGALDAPLAPLWVWLFFAETPSAATLIGGAIVFCAVIAHIGASTRRNVAVPQPA
jgi:drug/metabolite transporter (DMT)-like permease